VGVKIDADVKHAVIPIGFVIAAPLAVGVHAVDVVIDLSTVIAMAGGIAVNAILIGLQPGSAIAGVIAVRAERNAGGEH
jgi:hypothetical protein